MTEIDIPIARDIENALNLTRLSTIIEQECQLQIATALTQSGISFEREYQLGSGSRIDFMCPDGVGIEVKLRGRGTSIAKQLKKYEYFDQVKALILVTAYAVDPTPLGFTKPLKVIWISKAWL